MKTEYGCAAKAPRVLFCAAAVLAAALMFCGCADREILFEKETLPDNDPVSVSVESERLSAPESDGSACDIPQMIWVYVCGAVESPGVYELPEGSRVFEAVEAAGGLTCEAEPRSLNQASLLNDGEQITVFTVSEAGEAVAQAAGTVSGGSPAKVNINTASRDELMSLPGIGEARAASIIAYRESVGRFASAEDIMNIDGIKEKAFEKIKDYIEV